MTVKLVKHAKTGRIYVATTELLKRPDMRAITSRMIAAADDDYLSEQNDDEYLNGGGEGLDDDDLAGDDVQVIVYSGTDSVGLTDGTEGLAGTDSTGDDADNTDDLDDDSQESGGTINLATMSDEDLIAFANAEPYKLGATKGWNRSTIESKLFALMGG